MNRWFTFFHEEMNKFSFPKKYLTRETSSVYCDEDGETIRRNRTGTGCDDHCF